MDDLILGHLQDTLTPDDASRLETWRRTSAANETRFHDLVQLWRVAERKDPRMTGEAPPSLETLLHGAPHRQHLEARVAPRRSWRWPVVLGAATAVAAALILVVQLRGESTRAVSNETSSAEFVTDTAEMATARLDDGSVVRLAPSSRLRVSSGTQDRENWLDGHAFFAVAADKERPFHVRTRAGSVEVLGTRFDLKVEGSELQLVVTEGRVALRAGNERREVVAGETGRVSAAGVITVSPTQDAPELLNWTRNFLVFQDTPLHQVARELEERYGVRVLVPDSALGERTVTAWFTQQSLDQVLQAVCRAVQAHCTQANGMASIEP